LLLFIDTAEDSGIKWEDDSMKNSKLPEPLLCGWSSITEKMISNRDELIENYRDFCEAGFNMTGIRPFENQEKFSWVLEALEKYNIKYVFQSPRRQMPNDESVIEEDVRINCIHPNCIGVFIIDEPSITDFPVVEKLKTIYEKYLPDEKLVFSNLFPNYANTKQLGNTQANKQSDKKWVPIPSENLNFLIDEYEEYVESYMSTVKPPALCYDHYMISKAFRSNEESRKALVFRFMMNLSVIAKAGKKHNVPYWNIIQALSFCKKMVTPNFVEYRWMANMSYVLGISILVTFIYRNYYEEGGGPEEWYDAPVTLDGNKTFAYDIVKKTNTQLKKYLGILSDLKHQGVYNYNLPNYISSSLDGLLLDYYPDWVQGIRGNLSMIIGLMKNEKIVGLLFMNTSFEKQGKIEIEVQIPSNYELWSKSGFESKVNENVIYMDLEPGETSFLCKRIN
jgi:hypothetical protein